jgi:hypothetical protein
VGYNNGYSKGVNGIFENLQHIRHASEKDTIKNKNTEKKAPKKKRTNTACLV